MRRRENQPLSLGSLLQDERRLRIIGDWGSASGHIGKRWEALGTVALRSWVQRSKPGAGVVDLAGQSALQVLFDGLGLTNPDALLIECQNGQLLLRPIDLKWTLEVAGYKQISRAALSSLLSAAGESLAEAVRGAMGPPHLRVDQAESAWCIEDGFFFVVDSVANRRYLASPANARQEYPLEPKDVVFQGTSAEEFFSPLPGWPQALRLAQLDRSRHALDNIDGATAYYRLGAGVRGALLKLKASIFAPDLSNGDGIEAELEDFILSRGLGQSASIVASLEPELARRAEKQLQLRDLCRSPFTFDQFKAKLLEKGLDLDATSDPLERNRLVERYRLIARRHRDRVVLTGRHLIARDYSEAKALILIARRAPDYEQRALDDAQRLLADL